MRKSIILLKLLLSSFQALHEGVLAPTTLSGGAKRLSPAKCCHPSGSADFGVRLEGPEISSHRSKMHRLGP